MKRNGIKQILDFEWYGNTNTVRLFLHLLLKAKEEDDGTDIGKGSLLTCTPMLSHETGLTVKQVRTALEGLEKGRFVGRIRAGRKSIITICNYDSYEVSKTDRGQVQGNFEGSFRAGLKEQEEEIPPAPPKEEEKEKEKDKKKILSKDNIKEKEKEKSFVAPEYAQVFSLWLEYKRQRRESYKSEMSLKICYNKLVKLSGDNPDIAVAIVEQSIANNWAGLFELKNNNQIFCDNGNKQQTYISDPVARRQHERARRLQALAARLAASQAEDRGTDKLPF